MTKYEFWFIAGSQSMYGAETLSRVESDCRAMVEWANADSRLPFGIVYKDTVKTADGITGLMKEANHDDACAGIVTFCHTFSPSKMWINGLELLSKPWLHFHTQYNETIPDEEIDMDYMNLHQSAHGDREHGFIGARMRKPRKVVAGYWKDEEALEKIGRWMRASVGAAVSRGMKVMRFGDNMREVAVTEGDKIEAQIRLGWQVNTWPVGELAGNMELVGAEEIEAQMSEYAAFYELAPANAEAARYQAREEIAIRKMMDGEGCLAFTNTFQDLHGMRQLPGIASQDLMAKGYGYGGEGDWKVSAMTAVMKAMTRDMAGGTSFMEDYTYDMKNGATLGAHMLEVCPSVAAGKPRVEVHPLCIGAREAPARLVFDGKAGPAVAVSLVDMGGRFRMIVQDVTCIKPSQPMPNLPVARVMWKPAPCLNVAAECWILAGGAHHTVLSYDCDAEMMRDLARIIGVEYVHIGMGADPAKLERELFLADFAWKMKPG